MNLPTLISPAYAQDVSSMLGSATQFAPLVLIFVVFYFLLMRYRGGSAGGLLRNSAIGSILRAREQPARPQQQKQKTMQAMLAALKRGDKVVTGGGIIGVVQRVPVVQDKEGKRIASSEIEVEIGPNMRVTVLRETISSVINPLREASNDDR